MILNSRDYRMKLLIDHIIMFILLIEDIKSAINQVCSKVTWGSQLFFWEELKIGMIP